MRTLLLLIVVILSSAHAEDSIHGPRFGHNLTATSDVLAKGQCTIGLQLTSCGLSDHLTIGLSTWMLFDYKIAGVGARYLISEDSEGRRFAVQASYFKNTRSIPAHRTYSKRPYEMEALWLAWIYTVPMTPYYRVHMNVDTNYYKDDEMPFSLRRPIPGRNQGQLNLSTLHEIELVKNWFMQTEIGFLDLVQSQQYVHAGFSLGQTTANYHWHMGYSMSATVQALATATKRNDYQQELRETTAGYHQHMSRDKARRDYGLHPEFALQFFF